MMLYQVRILWKREAHEPFLDNKYSRAHSWIFDGGIELAASSSPHIVPFPMSKEEAVDPEEAFVASLSSCHMLWFLSIAAGRKIMIESYEDRAEGVLAKNEEGKLAMTEVTLKPVITYGGKNIPTPEQVLEIHHLAHEKCFISNSVKTKVRIVPG
jgi:organic hydroperoxide reductase OsmC/OhrA